MNTVTVFKVCTNVGRWVSHCLAWSIASRLTQIWFA